MNNLNNMTGLPLGGQQPQLRQQFAMGFQNQLGTNQLATGNPNPVAVDYTWHAAISRETRDNLVKQL